jgi:hypothetical protein
MPNQLKYKPYSYDIHEKEIIFVDGLTRVGKSMLNTLLTGFDKLSIPLFIEPLEQMIPLVKTGDLSNAAFSSLIRLHLNERFYNYYLSRNLNFRKGDLTSIYNSSSPDFYLEQLQGNDGDEIFERKKKEGHILQFQTHDVLTHYDVIRDSNINVRFIELFRDPIDTINSWYVRGWGHRFDKADPRSFTMLYEIDNKLMPHYSIGLENVYFSYNEMEKCVVMHNHLMRKSITNLRKLSKDERSRFLPLCYENVLTDTNTVIKKIYKFLGVGETSYMDEAKLKARLPRDICQKSRMKKVENIYSQLNSEIIDDLTLMESEYSELKSSFEIL